MVIYANDHPPAHVHVMAGEGEAKINLLGDGGQPRLVWADRIGRGDLRRAMHLVADNQATLLSRWEEIHERRR